MENERLIFNSGYTCGYVPYGNASAQTCVSEVSTGEFSAIQCYGSTSVLTQQTIPATVAASETVTTSYTTPNVIVQTMTIKAPLFQIIHQSTDLPKSMSTISTTQTSQPGTSLSTGAKAGIGVGAAAGGLILIGAALFLLYWRRKRDQRLFNPVADEPHDLADEPHELATDTSKAELPGHAIPVEVDALKARLPPAELG
ncbi:uncharacterized protein N7482_004354 [Penicillium canariense]|uniref:Uncharacterized protein n=1 Tax=Penicillium canariense TaxID=189055 RepID=A0A9W9LQ73_9EURO|nr:uncharacterized protein N7482_004354 [Penicillium canariense]KAJ5168760.1 hypothetical protein N7482_004354 [Penicillium canariense]